MSKISKNNLFFMFMILFMFLITLQSNFLILQVLFLIFLIVHVIINIKNKKELGLTIFFVMLFQMVSKNYTKGVIFQIFQYIDEVLMILFLFSNIIEAKRIKIYNFEKKSFILFIIFIGIGIVSNIYYKTQRLLPIVIDTITFSKFMVFYFFFRNYTIGEDLEKTFKDLIFRTKFVTVFLFILTTLNIFYEDLYPTFDYRYFMNSIQLFFPHPMYLSEATILLMIVCLYDMKNGKKNNWMYIAALSIITFFTFRTKSIACVAAILLLYFLTCIFKVKNKYVLFVFVLIITLNISNEQLNFYYNNVNTTARYMIVNDSIEIANDYFPLGSGFGTFGTNATNIFGSIFYNKYGYVEGSYKYQAMSDSFWPGVIAQTGWIGMSFYLLAMIVFIYEITKYIKKDSYFFVSALSIFLFEFMSTTSDTAFCNPMVTIYAIMLGWMFSYVNKESEKEKENEKKN